MNHKGTSTSYIASVLGKHADARIRAQPVPPPAPPPPAPTPAPTPAPPPPAPTPAPEPLAKAAAPAFKIVPLTSGLTTVSQKLNTFKGTLPAWSSGCYAAYSFKTTNAGPYTVTIPGRPSGKAIRIAYTTSKIALGDVKAGYTATGKFKKTTTIDAGAITRSATLTLKASTIYYFILYSTSSSSAPSTQSYTLNVSRVFAFVTLTGAVTTPVQTLNTFVSNVKTLPTWSSGCYAAYGFKTPRTGFYTVTIPSRPSGRALRLAYTTSKFTVADLKAGYTATGRFTGVDRGFLTGTGTITLKANVQYYFLMYSTSTSSTPSTQTYTLNVSPGFGIVPFTLGSTTPVSTLNTVRFGTTLAPWSSGSYAAYSFVPLKGNYTITLNRRVGLSGQELYMRFGSSSTPITSSIINELINPGNVFSNNNYNLSSDNKLTATFIASGTSTFYFVLSSISSNNASLNPQSYTLTVSYTPFSITPFTDVGTVVQTLNTFDSTILSPTVPLLPWYSGCYAAYSYQLNPGDYTLSLERITGLEGQELYLIFKALSTPPTLSSLQDGWDTTGVFENAESFSLNTNTTSSQTFSVPTAGTYYFLMYSYWQGSAQSPKNLTPQEYRIELNPTLKALITPFELVADGLSTLSKNGAEIDGIYVFGPGGRGGVDRGDTVSISGGGGGGGGGAAFYPYYGSQSVSVSTALDRISLNIGNLEVVSVKKGFAGTDGTDASSGAGGAGGEAGNEAYPYTTGSGGIGGDGGYEGVGFNAPSRTFGEIRNKLEALPGGINRGPSASAKQARGQGLGGGDGADPNGGGGGGGGGGWTIAGFQEQIEQYLSPLDYDVGKATVVVTYTGTVPPVFSALKAVINAFDLPAVETSDNYTITDGGATIRGIYIVGGGAPGEAGSLAGAGGGVAYVPWSTGLTLRTTRSNNEFPGVDISIRNAGVQVAYANGGSGGGSAGAGSSGRGGNGGSSVGGSAGTIAGNVGYGTAYIVPSSPGAVGSNGSGLGGGGGVAGIGGGGGGWTFTGYETDIANFLAPGGSYAMKKATVVILYEGPTAPAFSLVPGVIIKPVITAFDISTQGAIKTYEITKNNATIRGIYVFGGGGESDSLSDGGNGNGGGSGGVAYLPWADGLTVQTITPNNDVDGMEIHVRNAALADVALASGGKGAINNGGGGVGSSGTGGAGSVNRLVPGTRGSITGDVGYDPAFIVASADQAPASSRAGGFGGGGNEVNNSEGGGGMGWTLAGYSTQINDFLVNSGLYATRKATAVILYEGATAPTFTPAP
jgi:hypothetical protein